MNQYESKVMRMMFNLCIVFLLLSRITVAQEKAEINGVIKNSPNGYVYLVDVSDYTKVDSSAINPTTGAYHVSVSTREEAGYWLYFDKRQPVRPKLFLILNAGDQVTVETDLDRKSTPSLLQGSNATTAYHDFEAELNAFALENAYLYQEKSRLVKERASPARLRKVQQAILQYEKAYGQRLINRAVSSQSATEAFLMFDKIKFISAVTQQQQDSLWAIVERQHPNSAFLKRGLANFRQPKTNSPIESNGITIDEEIPSLDIADAENRRKILMDLLAQNSYTLIDVWASWCKPCREESPYLINAFDKYSSKGFSIVAISVDEKDTQWLKAIEKDQTQAFTHLIDNSMDRKQIYKDLKLNSIPANFLVDNKGRIVAKNLRKEALLQKLEELYR